MARGHEDLIPFDKRTEDEQRKIRSEGGKASGESPLPKNWFSEDAEPPVFCYNRYSRAEAATVD